MSSQISGVIKRVRPGDDLSTYCGRCKDERTHQVVAVNSDKSVERVICRTCQSDHLYRDRKKAGATGVKRAVVKAQRAGVEDPRAVRAVRPYSSGEVYKTEEWISHPKFGQGKIVEAKSGKITVRFGLDQRTLLHAG